MRTSTEYTYTSDGVKCSVMSGPMSGQVYLGSLVYKVVPRLAGGVGGHGGHVLVTDYNLESTSFGKGRIVGEGGSFVARYFITDHLGSTCCVTHGEEGDDAPVYEQSLYYLSFSILYTYNSWFSTFGLAGRPRLRMTGFALET